MIQYAKYLRYVQASKEGNVQYLNKLRYCTVAVWMRGCMSSRLELGTIKRPRIDKAALGMFSATVPYWTGQVNKRGKVWGAAVVCCVKVL